MTPTIVFYIIIAILIVKYIFDTIIDYLNSKHFNDPVPDELKDLYNEDDYVKSQQYKKANYSFSKYSSLFSLVVTLFFFWFEGFAFLDTFVRSITDNSILITLYFFGILFIANDLISLPFAYYKTFVIEEKFGFNKTTIQTFILDKLKGYGMLIIVGGGILALITWFYTIARENFWWYSWLVISVFTLFMNMFYSKLIVPLFNKQTKLNEGELKTSINNFAAKIGFKIENIFVIDGSKRTTKANAYFSGFGNQKRITLYDTLINDLNTSEIVAVLAHEVGHYKKHHIIYNMMVSIVITGLILYFLSILLANPILSQALGVKIPSFHIGLISFTILYSPISELTNFIMNFVSRNFEYQADDYAKENYNGNDLISALIKLSKNSLSNLTPHPLYVKIHYSHPTILSRIYNLKK